MKITFGRFGSSSDRSAIQAARLLESSLELSSPLAAAPKKEVSRTAGLVCLVWFVFFFGVSLLFSSFFPGGLLVFFFFCWFFPRLERRLFIDCFG